MTLGTASGIVSDAPPVFSVVIPLYNRANIITETIKSVLSQSEQNFEIIIVDDGSKDNPEPVIAGLNDPRIHYVRQENQGGATARNRGLDEARGDYIAFLDSDDFFLPEKFTTILETIKNHPTYDVYASYAVVDRGNGVKAKKPTRPPRPNERIDEYLFCEREVIQTSTIVVRKDTAGHIRFQHGLRKGQDIDYVLKLYHAGMRFYFINTPLAIWVDNAHSSRVSHINQAETLETWLEHNKDFMSRKAYYGYRSNVLSYEIAFLKPFTAIKDLFCGFLYGGVSAKNTIHSTMRAFIPQTVYRPIINSLLKIRNSVGLKNLKRSGDTE